MEQPPTFPPTLASVPAEARLNETFPFAAAALTVSAVLGLVGSLAGLALRRGPLAASDLYWPVGCAVVALVLVAWEVFRRRDRRVVVFEGDYVAEYRAGEFVRYGHVTHVTHYQLSAYNTLRELLAFAVIGYGAFAIGLDDLHDNPGSGLTALGVGVGMVGAFLSSVYARVACRHFILPGSTEDDAVMFTRGAARRFRL